MKSLLPLLGSLHLVESRHGQLDVSDHDGHHLGIVKRSHQSLLHCRALLASSEHIDGLLCCFACNKEQKRRKKMRRGEEKRGEDKRREKWKRERERRGEDRR